MYADKSPITSFSAVMSCYPEYVQIIANKNITSIVPFFRESAESAKLWLFLVMSASISMS